MSKDILLKTSENESLQITLYGRNEFHVNNLIIFVHGFKGFKDWGFGPYIGDYFSARGYSVVTFNFSHNGIGEDPLNFTDSKKFAENTFTREKNELDELIDAYKSGGLGDISGKNKIGLIGHSRGGAEALLSSGRVDCLVTWAAVSTFDRYTERQKTEWQKNGYIEVLNTRTNQNMRLNYSLLEDLKSNSETHLNIQRAANGISVPWLIIHGEQDLAVNFREAEKLYQWSNKKFSELIKIPGAGHTFDIQHPFAGSNPKFERVLQATNKFFDKYLINT